MLESLANSERSYIESLERLHKVSLLTIVLESLANSERSYIESLER